MLDGEAPPEAPPDTPLGFLIAFAGLPLRGPNHGWVHRHRPGAVYVDRVAVIASARGQGIARRLYEDLAAAVLASGRSGLACEVNLDPPNPGSLAFHTRLGFRPAGEARDPRNGKRVLYLFREAAPVLAAPPPPEAPAGGPPQPGPPVSRRNPQG
ncbi:GNAT family N-acetyltransferase [Roseomonas gilardii]|uniref:GNAT family N-acetyltransferase n=1 Tax=Roseomonas gilardii TaxID=257708 RepID=UPI001643A573|nr:GNAT family N-acetyltransferase [Roseomonas gilardii]